MYRDFVEAPERVEAGGKEWWIQALHHRDETIDVVNVYDENGDFVADFKTKEEAYRFISGSKEG